MWYAATAHRVVKLIALSKYRIEVHYVLLDSEDDFIESIISNTLHYSYIICL